MNSITIAITAAVTVRTVRTQKRNSFEIQKCIAKVYQFLVVVKFFL